MTHRTLKPYLPCAPAEGSPVALRLALLQQDPGAALADARQDLQHVLEVADVEHRQLQLQVACRRTAPAQCFAR